MPYQRLQEETVSPPAALDPPAPSDDSGSRLSSPDGEVHTAAHPWSDLEVREARLKADLTRQLDEMVERQQTAEGKCRHFQIEVGLAYRPGHGSHPNDSQPNFPILTHWDIKNISAIVMLQQVFF